MKLQSALGRICQELHLEERTDLHLIKTCVAIDNQFIYITAFGSTAEYLAKYGKKGGRIFLKDWELNVKKVNEKTVYDFVVRRLEVIDFKEA